MAIGLEEDLGGLNFFKVVFVQALVVLWEVEDLVLADSSVLALLLFL